MPDVRNYTTPNGSVPGADRVDELAIQVRNLYKSFGQVHAVNDVSFDVQRGEVFALLGPNGAGKTTSIEVLEGFVHRDKGDVQVLGIDPGDRREQWRLRKRIGVVLQELAVEPFFTVRQVLERNAGFYPAPRAIDDVLELIGLPEKANARVKTLSGGQQRRLDVGLGIVGNPELVFLDEPTTGLDPAGRRTTWELIQTLSKEGTTILLSSHYMDEVEALAHRVAVLVRGRIVAIGPPSSLGGRDHGQVTIRFSLPDEMVVGDLPIQPTSVDDKGVEIDTDDELVVLGRLVNWALEKNVPLRGLSVNRVTLEDVYLNLTREDGDESEGAA